MGHPMSKPWVDWRPIGGAPTDRDFLVYLRSGYVTRGRLINGKHLATDNNGPTDRQTDTTATHWADIPSNKPLEN